MIVGIGTDIVAVVRMRDALARHGERFAGHILAASEQADFSAAPDKARFLAKRFAAKEAFAKAFGTGLRSPVTLHAIAVSHDELGKPIYVFNEVLSALLAARHIDCLLSISDEKDYVVAFALLQTGN